MKKKKGFTLIELLAVIVVLAIIALIATPIVMNTIKNSKKGAAERSGESYVKQVELTIATEELNKKYVEDGTYDINSDGDICLNEACDDKLVIEMSGTKPSGGKVTITNGQVSTTGTSMEIGDYTVSYDTTKKTYVATENAGNTSNVLCTAKTIATNGNKAEGNYNYGDEYSCELGDGEDKTFYVLENNTDTVSLIMSKNIDNEGKGTTEGNTVRWSEDGDNSNGPVTALSYLASSTANWSKLDSSQISLPSKEQISQSYSGSMPTWLHENLNINNSTPYGYWTSTPSASDSLGAWVVGSSGGLGNRTIGYDGYDGVRPVITISKAQLG